MNLEYSVIYPAVNTPEHAAHGLDKQRTFQHSEPGRRDSFAFLEYLFASWGNMPEGESRQWRANQCRSMSVGDVVAIYRPDYIGAEWYICDSCGWLKVSPTFAQSWLDYPRQYGCCGIELNKWKVGRLAQAFYESRHCL